MAVYLSATERQSSLVLAILAAEREAEDQRDCEEAAAICIQSAWRAHRTRKMIRRLHQAAELIQRVARGLRGRRQARDKLLSAAHAMRMRVYDGAAARIQAAWRGYYVRAHVCDFYARQRYLRQVSAKNAALKAEAMAREAREEELKRAQEHRLREAARQRKMAAQHHLLSTKAIPGIYREGAGSGSGSDATEGEIIEASIALRKPRPAVRSAPVRRRPPPPAPQDALLPTRRGVTAAAEVAIAAAAAAAAAAHGGNSRPITAGPAATSSTSTSTSTSTKTSSRFGSSSRVQGPFRSPEKVAKLRDQPPLRSLRCGTLYGEEDKVLKAAARERGPTPKKTTVHATPFLPFAKATQRAAHAAPEARSVFTGTTYLGDGPGDQRFHYGRTEFRNVEAGIPAFLGTLRGVELFDEA